MRDSGLKIKGIKNLARLYGVSMVEFGTQSYEGFNDKIASIMLGTERRILQGGRVLSVNEELEPHGFVPQFDPVDCEWWLRLTQEARFKLKWSTNFLEEPSLEILQLRGLVLNCLSRYLDLYKKEYNGNRPQKLNAWPVFCKKARGVEVPHIHHFNPMNLSAVYYVGGAFGKNNGELEIFPDPRDPQKLVTYLPQKGNLLFFPSTLPHRIGVYNGSETRFSIGIDLWFK